MIDIEVKALAGGRFEVEAPGRHHEIFEGQLGAVCAANALAAEALRRGEQARVVAPQGVGWKIYISSRPTQKA